MYAYVKKAMDRAHATIADTWCARREARRRFVLVRRAGALDPRIKRDIGLEGMPITLMPALSALPALAGGSLHGMPPDAWPVAGANDNVGWRPGRPWLALS